MTLTHRVPPTRVLPHPFAHVNKLPIGNILPSPAVWRGVIDTLGPRLTLQARPTGESYFDAASNTQRYEIAYVCAAEDHYLDDTRFQCAGNGIRPATRSFDSDPVIARLFPDLVVRNGLTNSYTVWETTTKPSATMSACDLYGNCTTQRLDSAAPPPPPTLTAPQANVIAPADATIIVGTNAISVTFAAQSAAPLKSVAIQLDGVTMNTATFAQSEAIIQTQRTVNVAVATQGVHTLKVVATDWNGATQTDTVTSSFTLDTEAPQATIDVGTLTAQDTYQLGSGVLRLSGTASDVVGLSVVKVRVDDQPFVDAEFDGRTWKVAYPAKDPEGRSLTITLRATDLAGRRTQVTGSIGTNLVDGTPPDTRIESGPPNAATNATATFTFTSVGSEPAATFECRTDAGAFVPCASPTILTDLSTGTHMFFVRAVGSAGSVDLSPAIYTWEVTPTTPDVTITDAPAAISTSRAATFSFVGDSAAQSFDCQMDGGIWKPCLTGQTYANLSQGTHVFQVRAKDASSRIGTIVRYSWTIVNDAPVAADQSIATAFNRSIGVTLNVTDIDALYYRIVQPPTHGVLLGTAPNLTYVPDSSFRGSDAFTFVASDDETESNLATVSILVAGTRPTISIYLPLITRTEAATAAANISRIPAKKEGA